MTAQTPSPAARESARAESIRRALDLTAEHVARRIRAWFDEREVWTREDMLIRASQDAISLDDWLTHDRVKASGIRAVVLDPIARPRSVVYVLDRGAEGD